MVVMCVSTSAVVSTQISANGRLLYDDSGRRYIMKGMLIDTTNDDNDNNDDHVNPGVSQLIDRNRP